MQSRYTDADAAQTLSTFRGAIPSALDAELLSARTYTARLLGADPALVLHGGGNTSVKAKAKTLFGTTIDVLHIKGSGWDLATIAPPGHPAVRLAPLLEYRSLERMTDEDMVNELRSNLLDAAAPTPSVETLLHAFLPHRFIDHTHADAILALADQPDGEKVCREIFGNALVWVPYVMPGFLLAKRTADAYEAAVAKGHKPTLIILERHGVFTFGDTAKESYERMVQVVSRAEAIIGDKSSTVSIPAAADRGTAQQRAATALPVLRGVLAKLAGEQAERGPVLELRVTDRVRSFLARRDFTELAQIGCATPDHVIRTKPSPLALRGVPLDDPKALAVVLEREVTAYARAYDDYFERMCREKGVTKTKLDPWPRIVLLEGLGLVAVGKTRAEASIAADVYEHSIDVMVAASDVGAYAPVSRSDLFDVEYWSLEQAKIKKTLPAALAGRIAMVTGAASGIGKATAKKLLELGAHVVLVDRDAVSLGAALDELAKGRALQVTSITADVTQRADVERAASHAAWTFGGLDLVVSNAGNAPEGELHTDEGSAALRASIDLNLLAHAEVSRGATAIFERQGRGGCLLFNASKSAFNQGPGFGPYAVAKAGLLALMRQYAVDLGWKSVRANAVNADRIRTALFGGGVLESRAKARGLTPDEYFKANLLKREVTADDVAGAFAYLATARATTGCVITVDGGNAAAFPR
ncbi:MAG TPA: bifunctional aldolase/short-chain dehydrogenase [Polyangiaceae bacterium]|jgi:rhamnose utilization protein RhaD (predicted bifunctional aldolase and dehydrogenase)/NAD(P)-dependent dehydrogenase (short-subunit alcohol dehydrogenase family)